MRRDKFIAGQEQCALRRQLDGFAQGTPIGEIVDSCRVWESHSDSNWMARKGYDSEIGNQPSDSRTRERRKVGVVIEEREPEIEGRKESETPVWWGKLQDEIEIRKETPTGGLTWRWEENDGPTVNRCPRVGAVQPECLMTRRPHWGYDGDYAKQKNGQKQRQSPGNERRFGRVGQPLGPLRIKAPLALGGGGGFPPDRKKSAPLADAGRWSGKQPMEGG